MTKRIENQQSQDFKENEAQKDIYENQELALERAEQVSAATEFQSGQIDRFEQQRYQIL